MTATLSNTHRVTVHSKYIEADTDTVETGSFNYTQQARYNSENAVVISGNARVAAEYLKNWDTVTALGQPYRAP